MAHRCRPSSTFTWNRLRRSYRLGAVAPRLRCCSTEAGSVSPWITISPCSSERYSPRPLVPYGLALVLADPDAPARIAFGQEDAPPVFRHGHVPELRPSLAAHVD